MLQRNLAFGIRLGNQELVAVLRCRFVNHLAGIRAVLRQVGLLLRNVCRAFLLGLRDILPDFAGRFSAVAPGRQ